MKDTRVAKRYATALFGIAKRDAIIDAVSSDLELVERYLANVGYLRAVLTQPLVTDERKYQVVDHAFGDRVTATTLNFLKLLIRKGRENLINETIDGFRALAAELNNTVDASVTTAVPLTPSQTDRLTRSLQTMTGKTVTLSTQLDPSIIGGTVVRIGDTIIDGSVQGRLQRLEKSLLGTHSLGGVI